MNIFLVPLEQIETRYTCQWYHHIPRMLASYANRKGLSSRITNIESTESPIEFTSDVNIINLVGTMPAQVATAGAFINFASTNVWKSSQGVLLAHLFNNGYVKNGDKIYFTDSWNPVIIMARYMKDLMGIDVEIHGQWHAGWHDEWDQLAQRIPDPKWALNVERALFYAIDKNYFTTDFYVSMFLERLNIADSNWLDRTVRCGYPNSYLLDLNKSFDAPKEDLVLFPHRLAVEKQVDIMDDLAEVLKLYDIKVDVCQRNNYSKAEYHKQLAKAKLVISFALQETYGIAQTEAVFSGALPLSPDRLSYSEMYLPEFKYEEKWTTSFSSYLKHKDDLVDLIVGMVRNYDAYKPALIKNMDFLTTNYIGDEIICGNLIDSTLTGF